MSGKGLKKSKFWVKFILSSPHNPSLTALEKKALENIVEKRKKCCKPAFFMLPQIFQPYDQMQKSLFKLDRLSCLQMLSIWYNP